jgi:hypothetical protein
MFARPVREFLAGLAVCALIEECGRLLSANDPHLSDDKTVAKMGHPVLWLDDGVPVLWFVSWLFEGLVVAGFGVGAGLAEDDAVDGGFAVVVDAFAALGAGDAGGFVAGHFAGVEGDADPLF